MAITQAALMAIIRPARQQQVRRAGLDPRDRCTSGWNMRGPRCRWLRHWRSTPRASDRRQFGRRVSPCGDRQLYEARGVDHAARHVNAQVEMRSGRATGTTGESDRTALHDLVALGNRRLREVEVERRDAAAVSDHDDGASEERIANKRDDAVVDRGDRTPLARGEVESK